MLNREDHLGRTEMLMDIHQEDINNSNVILLHLQVQLLPSVHRYGQTFFYYNSYNSFYYNIF